ncbi:hypothetical protein [Streptomyces ureilyticus]|uniref:hypothetical protein n=1 Tax=Streptomyces ureilyticus TaxID=1775131 RepID=UPI001F3EC937|nr:hypothetical protein [Streptomyces ureilyticus]
MDVLSGEECLGFPVQLVGQSGCLQGCETDGLGPEDRLVEAMVAGGGFGGQSADALEEQAADEEFTAPVA